MFDAIDHEVLITRDEVTRDFFFTGAFDTGFIAPSSMRAGAPGSIRSIHARDPDDHFVELSEPGN